MSRLFFFDQKPATYVVEKTSHWSTYEDGEIIMDYIVEDEPLNHLYLLFHIIIYLYMLYYLKPDT